MELAGGKRKWKQGRFEHGQILGVSDLLLVLSETGELNLVELNPAKSGDETALRTYRECSVSTTYVSCRSRVRK